MYAATHSTRDENFLSMRIIESSGSSSTVGKSSRALLGYVRTAALEPASCISEESTIASQNSLRDLSLDVTNDNDTTAVRMIQDLSFRDLRVLDHHFDGDEIHSIIVRKGCVLITSDPFRAVVMADRLIVILPSNVKACDNMNDILEMFESCFTGVQLPFLKYAISPPVKLLLFTSIGSHYALLNSNRRSEVSASTASESGETNRLLENDDSPEYSFKTEYSPKQGNTNSFEFQVCEAIFTTINTLHR